MGRNWKGKSRTVPIKVGSLKSEAVFVNSPKGKWGLGVKKEKEAREDNSWLVDVDMGSLESENVL